MTKIAMSVLRFSRIVCLVVGLALIFGACFHVDERRDDVDGLKADISELEDFGDLSDEVDSNDICTGLPIEGCPCTNEYEECCFWWLGEGLSCSYNWGFDPPKLFWEHFFDCPCIPDPEECRGAEFPPLCPEGSHKR